MQAPFFNSNLLNCQTRRELVEAPEIPAAELVEQEQELAQLQESESELGLGLALEPVFVERFEFLRSVPVEQAS